jgi:pimeloyl-ACP methyl ester carboxylesterase
MFTHEFQIAVNKRRGPSMLLQKAKPNRPLARARKTKEKPSSFFPAHAPQLAGDRAFRLFCTPKASSRRSDDHDILTERARFHLRTARWEKIATTEGAVQVFILEPEANARAKSALIAHGWTSESSFMMVIAEQLRRAGFRVVLFDQPAHGYTVGDRASLIDCARALLDVAEAARPIHYAVAHSMGGLATLLVGEGGPPMRTSYPFERYVLIACPNAFTTVAREFGEEIGLSAPAQRIYERHLERIAHRTIASFNAADMLKATGRAALVLHSHDDEDVAFSCAQEITRACAGAELKDFSGLGHRKILYASPVVRAIIDYLSRP